MWLKSLFASALLAYHLRGQARYPYRPLAAILRDQGRRVRAMVAYAYTYVPYYHETMTRLGLTPADFQTAADLGRLPLLERHELLRDPEYFLSTAIDREDCFCWRSGGTTGKPVTVWHDFRSMIKNTAHASREGAVISSYVGKSWGYREAVVLLDNTMLNNIHRFLEPRLFLPSKFTNRRLYLSVTSPVADNLEALNAFQPDLIRTYGSFVPQLCQHLEALGTPFHRPRLIAYGSDEVPPAVRRLLAEKYQIPLKSIYGSVEALKIGFECEAHRGLHQNLDLYPVRLLNQAGKTAPVGETGELVVSNLVNRGTVLLNYRLGDLAAFRPEPCPCGRSLPLLSLEGRTNDVIRLPSGRELNPMAFLFIFRLATEIWQAQIVQRTLDSLEVRLVPRETCNREETGARVAEALRQVLKEDLRVEVLFVDHMERTPAGKVRVVLSLLPPAPGEEPER